MQEYDDKQRSDLEASAQILETFFNMSSHKLAKEWIEGWLKPEIDRIVDPDCRARPSEIPRLSLVTRNTLPEDEAIAYLNFWSMACYGEIEYAQEFQRHKKLLGI